MCNFCFDERYKTSQVKYFARLRTQLPSPHLNAPAPCLGRSWKHLLPLLYTADPKIRSSGQSFMQHTARQSQSCYFQQAGSVAWKSSFSLA